jgi:hypothetical protein
MFSFIHRNVYKDATVSLFYNAFHCFITLVLVSKISTYANKLFFKFSSIG